MIIKIVVQPWHGGAALMKMIIKIVVQPWHGGAALMKNAKTAAAARLATGLGRNPSFDPTNNWMGIFLFMLIQLMKNLTTSLVCTGLEQKNTFKIMPLEDGILPASQNVGLTVQELGVALNQILHTHMTCESIWL